MSDAPGRTAGGSCSVLSQRLGESAYGSAADATSWVCLEQDGPWGRSATTESHLDAGLGGTLDTAVSQVGGRFALVRRPGSHPDEHGATARTVLVAGAPAGHPEDGWLLGGRVDDPAELLALDVAALARGDRDGVRGSLPALRADDQPVLLVCTNGRRDVCCAVRGRPVAVEAAAARPGRVWETSHTGGHRFAPTAVLLPAGVALARLDVALAVTALDAAAEGRLDPALHGPAHDRGLGGLPAPARAAVSAVRAATGAVGLCDLTVGEVLDRGDGRWGVRVDAADGRSFDTLVRRRATGEDRPESCGKPAVPQVTWSVQLPSELLVERTVGSRPLG